MKKVTVILTSCLMLAALVCVSAADSGIGKELADTCSRCHSTKRICKMLGVKNADAWSMTINRMIDRGADLSKSRVDETSAYLDGLAPGSKPICD